VKLTQKTLVALIKEELHKLDQLPEADGGADQPDQYLQGFVRAHENAEDDLGAMLSNLRPWLKRNDRRHSPGNVDPALVETVKRAYENLQAFFEAADDLTAYLGDVS